MLPSPDTRSTRNLIYWDAAPSPPPANPRRGAADPDDEAALADEDESDASAAAADGAPAPRWDRPSMYVDLFESACADPAARRGR
jgi:hypothetical protein